MFNDTWNSRFIELAEHISLWSKDPSRKLGCVVVNDNKQILSWGYNGFPRDVEDSIDRYNDRETKYKFVTHAETNAIYNAVNNGVKLNGSTFYVYGLPVCLECAKALIQVGCKAVYWKTDEPIPENWSESFNFTMTMFEESGISVERLK